MNLLKMILKQKPNEAKCMSLFLGKLKENPEAKEIVITEEEASDYPDFEELLNAFKDKTYIEWSKEKDYTIHLTENFFTVFEVVMKMM